MSDYPDFEDLINRPEHWGHIELTALQRLMDRLKAIEVTQEKIMEDMRGSLWAQETVRNKMILEILPAIGRIEGILNEAGRGIIMIPGPKVDYGPPLAPATFRGHPVKTPEEIDSIGLPPETEEHE